MKILKLRIRKKHVYTCESSDLPSPQAPYSMTLNILFFVLTKFHLSHRQGEKKQKIKTQVINNCMFDTRVIIEEYFLSEYP
jgi:hypothetical protein